MSFDGNEFTRGWADPFTVTGDLHFSRDEVFGKSLLATITGIAAGRYTLEIGLSEMHHGEAGKRQMTIRAGSRKLVERLDIFTQAGGKNKPYTLRASIDHPGGELTLAFIADLDNAVFNWIAINANDGRQVAMVQAADLHPLREVTPATQAAGPVLYMDATQPVDVRVADLLGRMSLVEKVNQMVQIMSVDSLKIVDGEVTAESLQKMFGGHGIGVVGASFGDDSTQSAIKFKAIDEYLHTKTHLAIPALVTAECLHGVLMRGSTIFPQAIAMGCTWNPEMVRQVGAAVAKEASAAGAVQALSPLFEMARDPRWGRVEECYGECPTLVATIGVAFVKGMQGEDASGGVANDKVMCTAKHFAAYCIPDNGINIAPASLGEREFRSLFLVPFERAVREAHICSLMPAYNEADGTPAHANAWLLTKILREEWGFKGYVYSDWGGVEFLHSAHQIAVDYRTAALRAINAGVDLEAPNAVTYSHLPDLVRDGKIPEKLIDQRAGAILRCKFLAGLFDQKRPLDPESVKTHVRTAEHVALARRVAEESVILLKNEGNLLPLNITALKTIAVIGPNADQVQFGNYTWSKNNHDGVNVLSGLKQALGGKVAINYAKGCDLVDLSTHGFAGAVDAARNSDLAIVVIGDTSTILGGVGWEDPTLPANGTVGEGFDVTDPVPPGLQLDLVKAVFAAGKPTIVIMLHGRPYSVPWIKQNIPVVIDAFYPGQEQGHAIADILLGKVNPSGRLPVSIAQSAGHIPTVYDYKPTGRGFYHDPGTPEKPGRDYVFSSPDPLWPFGFGLSYTTFAYRDLKIETPVVSVRDSVKFSFTLANTGSRTGKEVAQIYYRQHYTSTTTPVMRLIRFQKVELQPGEERKLQFSFSAEELKIWNVEMQHVFEPGEFSLMVGASAADIKLRGKFTGVA